MNARVQKCGRPSRKWSLDIRALVLTLETDRKFVA